MSTEHEAIEEEAPEGWRTIGEPATDDVDALCLLIELWGDRCSTGFDRGRFEFCTRYSPTDEQEARMQRHAKRIVGMLPWFAPTRRARQEPGLYYAHVAYEVVYPVGFISGRWN